MYHLNLSPADSIKVKLIFEKYIVGPCKNNLTTTKIRACTHARTELLPVQFMSEII
jgi:hypothetical protein